MTEEKKSASSGANLSPYELVFGSAFFEEDRFPGIREEAEARGVDTTAPERFILLGTVGALLQELLPEGAGSDEFSRLGAVVYQGYHFWRFGKRSHKVTEEEARALVEEPVEVKDGELAPPSESGYVRLPRHLFWARIEEGATPEAVDGFFWTVAPPAEGAPASGWRLELLLPLGLFPGRPGFSTIVVEHEVDGAGGRILGEGPARPEGKDFENILPGGELQGWYGLVTELEVLRLTSRIFTHLAGRGAGVEDDE